MEKLRETILEIRQKLPTLRAQGLKETPTRTIIIDPLLEALGWDVRDPQEVELEYLTVDGKSVDYALKLNNRPVLLVEAKPLDASLEDRKAIGQVVAYAANDGIPWCVLTNGVVWRVFRSMEPCPAPEKLLFEVDIAPKQAEAIHDDQICNQLWRLSRAEMARGTLDELGEQIFTDGKVRKALLHLFRIPPISLLKRIREAAQDETFSPDRIRKSLIRLAKQWEQFLGGEPEEIASPSSPPQHPCDEAYHVSGKPQEIVALYRQLDAFCMSLDPAIKRRPLKKTINWEFDRTAFCCVHLCHSALRIWVRVRLKDIVSPPGFARDVSQIGHWGLGDVELRVSNQTEFEEASRIIRQSFDTVRQLVQQQQRPYGKGHTGYDQYPGGTT